MSEKQPENPRLFEGESPGLFWSEITLRDLFAAAALTGMNAHLQATGTDKEFAKWAYEYADAMLRQREEP